LGLLWNTSTYLYLYFIYILIAGGDGLIKFWNIKTSECVNTINAHEGKIWACDVSTIEENKPTILTGGTDSKIIQWIDVTLETEIKAKQEIEEKMEKEEHLQILSYSGEYYEAMKLSLNLSRKNDFMEIMKNFILQKLKFEVLPNNDQDNLIFSNDPNINCIIQNRRNLENSSISNQLNHTALKQEAQFNGKLKEIINDKELRQIVKSNLNKILEIIRDFNISSKNFSFCQVILKLILITCHYDTFSSNPKNTDLGLKNKGFLKQKNKRSNVSKINHIENFEIIKAYSEKHLERINRELTKSCLLDYISEKTKFI
jgi:WD40 repeat protein